jgi:hypothetical protein
LADKFQIAAREAGAIVNVTKIMDIEVSSLNIAFRTLANQGIDPSLDGLREVKRRLDETTSPAQRAALAIKLLGRSGLELAEMFALSNEEFEKIISNSDAMSLVTDRMTNAQDKYERTIRASQVAQEQYNVVATEDGRITKDNLSLWWQNIKTTYSGIQALRTLGVDADITTMNMDEMRMAIVGATIAQQRGVVVTQAQAIEMGRVHEAAGNLPPVLREMRQGFVEAKPPIDAVAAALRAINSSVQGLTARDWVIRVSAAITGEDQALLNWLKGGQQGTVTGFQGFGQGGGTSTNAGGTMVLAPWATAADRAYAAAHPDQFKAEGGPVRAGQSYIVGERGAETFVPRQDGTIVPNNSRNITVNVGSIGSQQDLAEFESMLRQSLRGVR